MPDWPTLFASCSALREFASHSIAWRSLTPSYTSPSSSASVVETLVKQISGKGGSRYAMNTPVTLRMERAHAVKITDVSIDAATPRSDAKPKRKPDMVTGHQGGSRTDETPDDFGGVEPPGDSGGDQAPNDPRPGRSTVDNKENDDAQSFPEDRIQRWLATFTAAS